MKDDDKKAEVVRKTRKSVALFAIVVMFCVCVN